MTAFDTAPRLVGPCCCGANVRYARPIRQIATLTNLRLLVKTSSSASAAASSGSVAVAVSAFDKLDGIKLKCSTSLELELIESIGKSVDFKVSERLWEAL